MLLPDSAVRYLTKYLDDEWMRQNGFLGPEPGLGRVSDLLAQRPKAAVQTAQAKDAKLDGEVGPLVDTQFSAVDMATPVATLSGLFNQNPVVLVVENRELRAVITKIDLIEYMAKHLNAA